MFKGCCGAQCSPREFFLHGVRLAFGIWLLYAGLMKWMGGPANFVGYITNEFAKTWSPGALNTLLAWLIIIAEPVLGVWLISGVRPRCAWKATTLLMFLLLIGMTMLGKPEVTGNWQFFILCLGCAAWTPEKDATTV